MRQRIFKIIDAKTALEVLRNIRKFPIHEEIIQSITNDFGPQSVATAATYPAWYAAREALKPNFGRKANAEIYFPVITTEVNALEERLLHNISEPVSVHDMVSDVIKNVILNAVSPDFFVFMNAAVRDEGCSLSEAFHPSRTTVHAKAKEFLTAYRDAHNHKLFGSNSILDNLMKASGADGASLSNDAIWDHIRTVYFAGSPTMRIMMMTSIRSVLENGEISKKTADEARATTIGPEDANDLAKRLPYINAVLMESLRIYPPLNKALWRAVDEEETLPCPHGPGKVAPGDKLEIDISCIHHDPKYHVDPMTFNPNRSFKEGFLPFGSGERVCIGSRLAMMTGIILMHALSRNFDLTLANDFKIDAKIKSERNMTYFLSDTPSNYAVRLSPSSFAKARALPLRAGRDTTPECVGG
jgi:cytochrome P450